MDKSNFKVKELIGEGGQAKVYRVNCDGTDYALKIFRHEKYFRREIGIMKLIKEKFDNEMATIPISTVYGEKMAQPPRPKHNPTGFSMLESAVKIRSKYYGIVMSIHERNIKSIQFKKKSEIMNLGIQLMHRVRELHSLGYAHLDIKPSNIMADKKPEPDPIHGEYDYFLIDFGLVTQYIGKPKLELNTFDKHHFTHLDENTKEDKVENLRKSSQVILIRHGKSIANEEYDRLKDLPRNERFQKWNLNQKIRDARLSDLGIEQATQAQGIMNNLKVHTVFVSPLRRTLETAYNIFKEHEEFKSIRFVVVPALRESLNTVSDIPENIDEVQEFYSALIPQLDYSMLKDYK